MMRWLFLGFCFPLLIVCVFIDGIAKAGDWRFPVSVVYVSNLGDVADIYQENLEAEGFEVIDFEWPIGISFQPYVQYDNGLRVGGGIGPMVFILSEAATFSNIPFNLNGGYTFFPSANTSPYVRAGVTYSIVSGDYVKSKTPGYFGGIGIEFLRQKRVGIGIDVTADTSEIELDKFDGSTEKVNLFGLMISAMVIF